MKVSWFSGQEAVIQGLLATLFTYFVTAAGAALVFFFKTVRKKPLDLMMGFSAGVMIAASFWSLLAPAIELSTQLGKNAWLTAGGGFAAGGMFVIGSVQCVTSLGGVKDVQSSFSILQSGAILPTQNSRL